MDDVLRFAGGLIALPLEDLPREDDVLEVEDGEAFIVEFVRGVGGYDAAECPNQMAFGRSSPGPWPSVRGRPRQGLASGSGQIGFAISGSPHRCSSVPSHHPPPSQIQPQPHALGLLAAALGQAVAPVLVGRIAHLQQAAIFENQRDRGDDFDPRRRHIGALVPADTVGAAAIKGSAARSSDRSRHVGAAHRAAPRAWAKRPRAWRELCSPKTGSSFRHRHMPIASAGSSSSGRG